MASITRLRTTILTAFSPRSSAQAEQELFEELIVCGPLLAKIFNVGPRSPNEQREVETGKAIVNGKPLAFNADFARQVIHLSQLLDCSEFYIASLLHSVTNENPNAGTVACLEITINDFHRQRRQLADCLRLLFNEASKVIVPEHTKLSSRIDDFIRRDLLPEGEGGRAYFAQEVLKQIGTLSAAVSKAQTDKQNAGSNTTIHTAQGGPITFGADILMARLESLKYERRSLATILYTLSRLGHLRPADITQMVESLSQNPNQATTYYILAATLTAFETVTPKPIGGKTPGKLANDKEIMPAMKRLLMPTTSWRDTSLKATILLKWTLFLTESRHLDPTLENHEGFKTEELEQQVWDSAQGGAFSFLALAVMQLHRPRDNWQLSTFANGLALSPEQGHNRELPDEGFRTIVLFTFERLLRSLITNAFSELRKIKQRQEDVVLASARDRTRTLRPVNQSLATLRPMSTSQQASLVPPRNDIAVLLSFIGLLYMALPPEVALPFWGAIQQHAADPVMYSGLSESTKAKLPQFLQWVVWSTQTRDLDMSMALYNALAGLANGQQCSELCYNFLAKGGSEVIPGSTPPSSSSAYSSGANVSWTVIFGLLDSWASVGTAKPTRVTQPPPTSSFAMTHAWQNQPPAPIQSQRQQQQTQHPELGPKDILLAQSFLRLLATVVTHSVPVRLAITGNTHFHAITTLVSLIPLSVPLELKGALFDTLAAFCEPGAGAAGVEICKTVWSLMERLEVINVRIGQTAGTSTALITSGKGVEVELEEVEAVYKQYPATIPFLKLLCTLIHSPKRIPLKDRAADAEPINTIPEALGQAYRLPGIGPFVSFVLDHVFAKIPMREYLRPSDRWQTNDLCLCFVEQCLASYDLHALQNLVENRQLRAESMVPFLVHPGYDIMKRLLMKSPLQNTVLAYISEGVEGFERHYAEEEPYFCSTVVRVLRIVLRVLEIQDIFLDILVPILSEFDSAPIAGTVYPRSAFTAFDQTLAFRPQLVPALAAYIAYPAYAELVLLTLKIMTLLSSSPAFSNLLALIERSSESDRILNGLRRVVETDSMEDVATAEDTAESYTGAGAPAMEGPPPDLEQAMRLAALEFFIQSTASGRPYPNLGHYLLFGNASEGQQIQDPHALGAERSCIHVLLDQINAGVPRAKGRQQDTTIPHVTPVEPLFVTQPAVAERCYRVICQLCTHPKTSDFFMRYLRTREDFFARQVAAIPAKVPETLQEPLIEVLYDDGSRVITTVPALGSFLRLRSWILDLVALDLHIVTSKGHHKDVADLLEILFGNNSQYVKEQEYAEDDQSRPFREIGQSPLRIIEFVQSLNFDWSDSLTVVPVEIAFYKTVNLQACVRIDSAGCEIVDRDALLALLASARRNLYTQGRIVTQAHAEQLRAETAYILESCAVENHRREVVHATATSYESWRRLLDMALAKCFVRLPHQRRENMLFDLLHVLPATICSPSVQQSTAVLLSEAVLSLVTKLREDRRHQLLVQYAGGDPDVGALPAERLYHLLRSILECLIDNTHDELVRGNLYAALINYIHLIASSDANKGQSTRSALSISLSSSTTKNDFTPRESNSFGAVSKYKHGSASAIETGSLTLMRSVIERLVAIVSRDAIDGSEVWKTVAFMCLVSLMQLSRAERQMSVLGALIRHGILSNFVTGLRDSDEWLQSILKPEPENLNPLYVYEAKMTLFIRLSQTRAGAERLLEARILPILAQCDFLDARPEADQVFMHQDSFLPSAIQRYHQLFMPALQVVDGILATLGSQHTTAANQALEFLSSHRDTIVILLKNDLNPLPLSIVEEIHLLITLCASVFPLVPKAELISSHSGFGGIHAAILSLATRTLDFRHSSLTTEPQTDAEILDASVYASGLDTQTKFEVTVRQKERLLRKAVIGYLGTASEFTEPEIAPVLSPVAASSRRQESQFAATVPTLGDAIDALGDLCHELTITLQRIASLSAEIAAKDQVRVDNIRKVVDVGDGNFLQELSVGQKRALICRELARVRGMYKANARTLLGAAEMLLLLLWRHASYYSEGEHLENPQQLQASMLRMSRALATPDMEEFQEELRRKLTPVLHRLDIDFEHIGDGWISAREYFDLMRRRLTDLIEVHDTSESAQDGY